MVQTRTLMGPQTLLLTLLLHPLTFTGRRIVLALCPGCWHAYQALLATAIVQPLESMGMTICQAAPGNCDLHMS